MSGGLFAKYIYAAVPGKGLVWCDIYLLGRDHLEHGTSRHGTAIADGTDLPQNPAGGTFSKFDYEAACAVMKHHGKQLLRAEDFFAAAYGVTEKTVAPGEPKSTGLDAPRTSQWGLMQAAGNMWVWGTDGHPTMPRASLFGGSWYNGDNAGSRYANLDNWPDNSNDNIGARGRSDDRNSTRRRSRSRRSSTTASRRFRWSALLSCFGEHIAGSGIAGRRGRDRPSRPAAGISLGRP